ncbi:hypothetical protein [Saccharothrix yanglingensis]|uniref:hypothetical protein n=1 Tax=Saccharothrix yanglingensis TaxID=659496 RepID=UPI0027D2640C|nr:hypothetical protein [Saccharothrix yanglingensis]
MLHHHDTPDLLLDSLPTALTTRPWVKALPADHGPSAPSGSWFRSWHENPARGYRRIHGELLVLGITVAASTVWQILKDAGTDPAPEHTPTTRATFLRSRTDALPACDFFETHTLNGTRLHVLAVIEHTGRRIRVPGATAHPTASWVTQAVGNLVMDLEDAGSPARFPIRDRDGTFPALFDAVLADAELLLVGAHGRGGTCLSSPMTTILGVRYWRNVASSPAWDASSTITTSTVSGWTRNCSAIR